MFERDMHLIDDTVCTFGAGEEADFEGGRVMRDEEVCVEAAKVAGTDAAGESGDVCRGTYLEHEGYRMR